MDISEGGTGEHDRLKLWECSELSISFSCGFRLLASSYSYWWHKKEADRDRVGAVVAGKALLVPKTFSCGFRLPEKEKERVLVRWARVEVKRDDSPVMVAVAGVKALKVPGAGVDFGRNSSSFPSCCFAPILRHSLIMTLLTR